MKCKTLQNCSLKHSIKKGTCYYLGKLNYFKPSRGSSSPPPSLTTHPEIFLHLNITFEKERESYLRKDIMFHPTVCQKVNSVTW